jgi:hypothetical protein
MKKLTASRLMHATRKNVGLLWMLEFMESGMICQVSNDLKLISGMVGHGDLLTCLEAVSSLFICSSVLLYLIPFHFFYLI